MKMNSCEENMQKVFLQWKLEIKIIKNSVPKYPKVGNSEDVNGMS